jgi:hypothetical protein
MDLLAFAELPFATLAFAATVWLLSKVWGLVHGYITRHETRARQRQEILYHVAHLHVSMRSTLRYVSSLLGHVASNIEKARQDPSTNDTKTGDDPGFYAELLGAIRALWREETPEGPAAGKRMLPPVDFTSSEPFFKMDGVIEALDTLEDDIAALVLNLAEEKRWFDALEDEFNAANDDPEKLAICVKVLIAMQWSIVRLVVTSKAITDKDFRHRFTRALRGAADRTAQAAVVLNFAREAFPDTPDLWRYVGPKEKGAGIEGAKHAPPGFELEKLDNEPDALLPERVQREIWASVYQAVLLPRPWKWRRWAYALPALATAGLALALVEPGAVRAFYFPEGIEEPMTCNAKIRAGGVVELTCPVDGGALETLLKWQTDTDG